MPVLKNITNNPTLFFEILPEDWQESIIPHWSILKDSTQVFVLEEHQEICAGGIIFSSVFHEMDGYKEEAKHWFSKDYLYLGYIWVPLEKRNNNYGSTWMNNLLHLDRQQKYWLTTEDKSLKYFYKKIGFSYIKTLRFNGVEEELFVLDH